MWADKKCIQKSKKKKSEGDSQQIFKGKQMFMRKELSSMEINVCVAV